MVPKIEIKRMEVEIMRVAAAGCEMELKIEERLEEVERLRGHILIQNARVAELTKQIKEAKEANEAELLTKT
jgi:hypothetical protein